MFKRRIVPSQRTSSTDPVDAYRAGSAPIWGGVGVTAGVLLGVLSIAADGLAQSWPPLAWGLAVALVSAALFFRPVIVVNEHAVVVHNVLQIVTVPFARLKDLETRWGLELVVDDGSKVGAFAAPDPNRRDRKKPPSEQASASLVAMIRGAEEQWLEGPHRSADESKWADRAPTERRWDPVGVGLVVAAFAAAAVGFFLV